jgi:hypothetical protein
MVFEDLAIEPDPDYKNQDCSRSSGRQWSNRKNRKAENENKTFKNNFYLQVLFFIE